MKDKSTARTIKNNGCEIYYWVTDIPGTTKSTVVMHPGGGMNHASFEPLETCLNKRGHPTVLLEPRGIGYSQIPHVKEQFTLERFSSDLQTIIEQEHLVDPSLLAHSFGFMPVVDYTARTRNAKDITGVCVSHDFRESTFPGGAWLFGNIVGYINYISSAITAVPHLLRGEKREYNNQSRISQISPLNDLAVMAIINDCSLKELKSHLLTNKALSRWNVSKQLGKIKIPIHLIHGLQDFMVYSTTPQKIVGYASGVVTSDKLFGTHTLPYTQPEVVAQAFEKYQ